MGAAAAVCGGITAWTVVSRALRARASTSVEALTHVAVASEALATRRSSVAAAGTEPRR